METLYLDPVILLTIFGIGEWALITTVLCLVFWRLYRVHKRLSAKPVIRHKPADSDPSFSAVLQEKIAATNQQLQDADAQQTRLLSARLSFLQSELAACDSNDNQPKYWADLCLRLGTIMQTAVQEAVPPHTDNEVSAPSVTLLEVPEIDDVLANNEAAAVISPLVKLRNIVTKQHGVIDTLKSGFLDNPNALPILPELRAKLEELEVTQAHLNFAIDTLGREFTRLQQQATTAPDLAPSASPIATKEIGTEVVTQEVAQLPPPSPDPAEWVRLETEIADKVLHITRLETEISALRALLAQKALELKPAEPAQAVPPATDPIWLDSDDPVTLTQQLEQLTELLVRKSERLSLLQMGLPLPEDIEEEPPLLLDPFSGSLDDRLDAIEADLTDAQAALTDSIDAMAGVDHQDVYSTLLDIEDALPQLDNIVIPKANLPPVDYNVHTDRDNADDSWLTNSQADAINAIEEIDLAVDDSDPFAALMGFDQKHQDDIDQQNLRPPLSKAR